MADFAEIIHQALQANEKNINDLISQDLSLTVLAYQMIENPVLESQIEAIFQKNYLQTVQILENLFLNLLANQSQNFSEVNIQHLKQNVQLFVNQLIEERKVDLREKIRWLKKTI